MPVPAAAAPPPYRWERVEAGLGEWAGQALALPGSAVLWGGHRVDRPELPYLSLQRISGPTARGLALVRRRWPGLASILVSAVLPAVGEAVRFRVDGWVVAHVRAPGEDLADVRDALIEQCAPAAHLAGWSATPSGAGGIVIVPDSLGEVGRVDPLRGCTATVTTAWARRLTLDFTARVRIAALGARSQSPASWITGLRLAMDDPDTLAQLRRYGLSFRSRAIDVDPRDVEAPPEVEEVAAMDVFVAWQGQRTTALGAPLAGALISGASSLIVGPGDPVDVVLDLDTVGPA